jgi:hypothetical protein
MDMASPGDLVRTLADVLGMSVASVTWHDRILHEANLRSKSGRGSGAARLTPRDAANLLTAILASNQPKEAAEAVALYAATRPNPRLSSKKAFASVGLTELEKLPSDHSFIDALEALVTSGIEGSLAEWLDKHKRGRKPSLPKIDVAASSPGAIGDIRISGILEGVTAQVCYMTPGPWNKTGPILLSGLDEEGPDLAQSRSVRARSVVRISDLLAGRGN